jgi:hypothetical protein
MAKTSYWMVTIQRRFLNTGGKTHQRTFVTDAHPLEVLKNEGDTTAEFEPSIVFAMPIDEAAFQRHSHILHTI